MIQCKFVPAFKGLYLHTGRSVELDLDDITGQQLRLKNVQLHVAAPQCDHLVQRVDDAGHTEEDPKLWRTCDSCEPMDDAKEIEEHVELVHFPEEVVSTFPDERKRVDEYGEHGCPEHHPRDSGEGLEEPVGNVGLSVAAEVDLFAEAEQVLNGLGANVVEVDEMADAV